VLPFTNTTYYYRVKTVDAGLMESAWSATGNLYTLVASSAPSTVTNLAAGAYGEGQITLTWTAPLNINSGGTASYDIRYSTTAAITNDTEFNNATALVGEPTPGSAGDAEVMGVTGLNPLGTYYFALKSSNSNGTSALDTISPRPSAVAGLFNATQIDVGGLNNGFIYSSVAWGDFDNDGDLDVLVNGYRNGRQLCIYKSNGNGTFDLTPIEVDGVNNGLEQGGVAWGDFDNDGDLDILVNGLDGTYYQLRVYKNNGNGTIDPAQIEVDGVNNGLYSGIGAWGDFDNDGDLDILANGWRGNKQLRIYRSNGNATFDADQIEVDGLDNGLYSGGVVWGDYDKDGDLDILVSGSDATNKQLRVYKNSGNGTIDATQIEVDGLNNGLYTSSVAWGDFDSDGDLDILAAGEDQSAGRQLRIYKNNNDGSFDPTQVEVDGANRGFYGSAVAWGDTDNDGDLDVLASGRSSGATRQLQVYKNNGNATFDGNQIEVERSDNGLQSGGVAWGDFDNDGDLDILASGSSDVANNQLRVYSNFTTLANTPPTAPATLSRIFAYNPAGVSIASMTWSAGTDSGTGATVENGLTYDLQISTTSNFSKLMFPGQLGASPRMGSYLKPPKIFNSNTHYGVVLKSTDPWNTQTTASYGLRTDTTYYYRVKTVDSVLAESAWSSAGTLNTGVSPSTSTIASTAGEGEVTLTWASAGDDGMIGNLTGNYRIQYATYTASWSTSTTPTNANTVTISTTNVVPRAEQTKTISGLLSLTTYYFVLWSKDEVNNWSSISNTTSVMIIGLFDPNQIEVDGGGRPIWGGSGETTITTVT
ncbi:MAG: VCBS repeat-containing protein, partial [Elusimicrobia bacterium]|nr:VCBS repeat-containing protein [Elusimicrobiota bacterium]